MIRCTIEMLPGGDSSKARVIGLVEIANIGVFVPGMARAEVFSIAELA